MILSKFLVFFVYKHAKTGFITARANKKEMWGKRKLGVGTPPRRKTDRKGLDDLHTGS